MKRSRVLLCSLLLVASQAFAQSASVESSALERVAKLLEESGDSYSKLKEGVWSIPFKGHNLPEIDVRVTGVDDLVIVLNVVAERKDLKLTNELLVTLLEKNNDFDTVKVLLDEDSLMIRLDIHATLLDGKEWQYAIGQVASAADELHGLIKGHLKRQ